MEQFNSYLMNLDLDALRTYFAEHGRLCKYEKEERFAQQGTVCRYIGLIVKGYFKYTTLNTKVEESVMNFAFENEFVADFNSSYSGNPSEVSIIAGMDSEIYVLPFSVFNDKFMHSDGEMPYSVYRSLYHIVYDRYLYLHRHPTQERYLELIRRYPRLLDTVSLKDIASYLLITPNHLSRIRKEISQGNKS